jgi:hypothetical protein
MESAITTIHRIVDSVHFLKVTLKAENLKINLKITTESRDLNLWPPQNLK